MVTIDPLLLVGQSETSLTPFGSTGRTRLHTDVIASLTALSQQAKRQGFELSVVSGFRSFNDQLGIWNAKARGKRPVLDSKSRPIDISSLEPHALVKAILRWSALPGASRHHWGSDFDVIDAAALPAGYKVQLIPDEVEKGGMFAPFHDWLDANMAAFGFYRPYDQDRGGVSPERWHLSYAPLASRCLKGLNRQVITQSWAGQDVALRNAVEDQLDLILEQFVWNVAPIPPALVGKT